MDDEGKVFNDPIYGHIFLPEFCVRVVDTRQFQRLRELKQLGASYYVYYGATHNRFEHSIGVCHMARLLIEHLQISQPNLNISLRDKKCVMLAALCHDLGHGPFSHLFDSLFIPAARPNFTFCHEKASEDMLEAIVKENPSIGIDRAEDLIHGEARSLASKREKAFLFDIVCNKRNSIDVDKFDYIHRDCHNIGIKCPVDVLRLITFTRVLDSQICFNQKEAYNLYELFHVRYSLFKRVYTHKVSTAIEYMIRDILLLADKELCISTAIDDMDRYVNLNDSILNEIARSTSKKLKPSRDLLSRLRTRDLYRFADQVIIPVDLMDSLSVDDFSPEQIIKFQIAGPSLEKEDIIVEWLQLNYALKDRNPIDSVRFFSKHAKDVTCPIPRDQVSAFIPSHYREVTCRVYSKYESKCADIQHAFRRLMVHLNGKFSSDEVLLADSQQSVTCLPDWQREKNTPIADVGNNLFLTTSPSPRSSSRLTFNYALTLETSPSSFQGKLEAAAESERKRARLEYY